MLTQILPLYLLIVVGYLAGRFLKVDAGQIGKVSLFVLTPAVIFSGFYRADLGLDTGLLFGGTFALVALTAGAAHLVASRVWHDGTERFAAFGAASGNTGFFGIPACVALLGPDAFAPAVIYAFGTSFFENSVGVYIVSRSAMSARASLKRVLRFPAAHACLLGVALNWSGVELGQPVERTIDYLTVAYPGIGMMIVGFGLAQVSKMSLDGVFLGIVSAFRFLIFPAAALALVLLEAGLVGGLDPLQRQVILIQAMTPVAVVTAIHAATLGLSADRASMAVALSTLISLAWIPFAFPLLKGLLP